MNDLDT